MNLPKNDTDEKETLDPPDEQLEILEREQELHLSGQNKSYSRDEARQIIKGERSF